MIDPVSRLLCDAYWHPVCHRSEVAKARDFVRMDFGDGEIVAFHDGADVRVFDNLCPHRGARIFEESAGNAPFLCAYHGWSYSRGRIFHGNSPALSPDMPMPCLNTFATEWVGDFLFAARSPTHSLDHQLGRLRGTLEAVSRSCANREDFNAYEFECDWRIAVENALESYHVSAIHPESLGVLQLSKGTVDYECQNSLWTAEVQNEALVRKLSRIGRFFSPEYSYNGYWSLYVFPFSMISSTFGYSYSMQNFFPSSRNERTEFNSRLYGAKLTSNVDPQIMDGFMASTAQTNRKIFDEDHQICKKVPLRSWSSSVPPYLSNLEDRVAHFRTSMKAIES